MSVLYKIFYRLYPIPSFCSSFLMCCAILPNSFGGKGPHLSRWMVQQLHLTVSYLRLSEVFLSCKANAKRSVHSPRDHFIISLIISDRRDWRDTRGKWPLARNPNRSCWHRHNSVKLFFPPSLWLHERQKKTLLKTIAADILRKTQKMFIKQTFN